ncbi:MAG: dicarboxylate/amino acid:cation symporter [Candidatus Paceibacteria bacterium]
MDEPLQKLHPKNLKYFAEGALTDLLQAQLWVKILIGLFAGILTGLALGPAAGIVPASMSSLIGDFLALPGQLFLVLVQMIVIPLVVSSVIRGIASSQSMEQLKSLGLKLIAYFAFTTTVSITIGIGLAFLLQPGKYVDFDTTQSAETQISEKRGENVPVDLESKSEPEGVDVAEIPASVLSVFPENPLNAAVKQEMLQVVIFSIIFGLALVSLAPKNSKPLLDVFGSIQSVSMQVVKWAMHLAPFAVFGLIAKLTINTGIQSLIGLSVYVGTMVLGLLLLLIIYLTIMFSVVRMAPWTFLGHVRELQLLAFSTGSSVAVLPLTIKTLQNKLHVRPSTSQFVAPLGATVNMDATALFQGLATVFLAQVYSIELAFGTLLLLVLTAIGSSIGTPATPGVGVVILATILTSVGIPTAGVALILGVDRILEMLRTSVNVTGDVVASSVMDRWCEAGPSYQEEVESEEVVEDVREETGEDVVVGEFQPQQNPVMSVFSTITDAITRPFRSRDEQTEDDSS